MNKKVVFFVFIFFELKALNAPSLPNFQPNLDSISRIANCEQELNELDYLLVYLSYNFHFLSIEQKNKLKEDLRQIKSNLPENNHYYFYLNLLINRIEQR